MNSSALYGALTLTERIAALVARSSTLDARNTPPPQVRRWFRVYPQLQDAFLHQYLDARQVSYDLFEQALCEPIEVICHPALTIPDWMNRVGSAYADPNTKRVVASDKMEGVNKNDLFLELVAPLIRDAKEGLRTKLHLLQRERARPFDLSKWEAILFESVKSTLVQMLMPVLMLELNVARLQGSLSGATSEERFQDFISQLRVPELAQALLHEYPVLARQAVECLEDWQTLTVELLERLACDWVALGQLFNDGQDLGELVGIEGNRGDAHQRGRSVLILKFTTGTRIVYKPRPMGVAAHFQELLCWLNDRGANPQLKVLKVLDRAKYGWVEFVAPAACQSPDAIQRFYQRQGEYLALLYVLQATDFHYENLIAVGEHPMLVDLETLFQPQLDLRSAGKVDRALTEMHRNSVLRVGLLPQRLFGRGANDGIDLSGMGAAAGQVLPYPVHEYQGSYTDEMRLHETQGTSSGADNRPIVGDGADIDLLDYADEISDGFAAMYELLAGCREELLAPAGPLVSFSSDTVRVVLRPTLIYGLLLRASFHPDVLRSALERDMIFDSLWAQSQNHSQLSKIFSSEIDDLQRRDVPLFLTSPKSLSLTNANGQAIPNFFSSTGWSLVRQRLSKLDDDDRDRQLWFVRASLATTVMDRESFPRPVRPRRPVQRHCDSDELLCEAQRIGDRLQVLALPDNGEACWMGLTLRDKDHWSLSPLGLDLYGGLPGVALFLAYLGQIIGQSRYATLAESAVTTVQSSLENAEIDDLGIGAYDGIGGIVYLFTHLGSLWKDSGLLLQARHLAQRMGEMIADDQRFDVTGGCAGALLSLLSLHRVTECDAVLATAVECGNHLLENAQAVNGGAAWAPYFPTMGPLAGLAHGASGVGWALMELSRRCGEPRFSEIALAAFAYEDSLYSAEHRNWSDLRENEGATNPRAGAGKFMVGWCHGAPGIALTRLNALRYRTDHRLREAALIGLDTTLRTGFVGNQSLCHGSLGNLEPLIQAADILGEPHWQQHIEGLRAEIVEDIRADGWLCGVPMGVETPGLMTGLSGIGYGLLRAARPSSVPPVLLLAPPHTISH